MLLTTGVECKQIHLIANTSPPTPRIYVLRPTIQLDQMITTKTYLCFLIQFIAQNKHNLTLIMLKL